MVTDAAHDQTPQATVLNEYDLSLASLDCAGASTRGIDCAPLRQSILNHIKTTNPKMLAELDRLDQKRIRERAVAAAVAAVWTPVEQVGDEIAKRTWMVEYEVSKLGQMPPLQRRVTEKQIQGSRLHIAAIVQQQFCPAKKAFMARAGAAEFIRKAGAHCKDNAPTGSAEGRYYAGAETGEVILTKQCQAALASSCP